MAQAVAEGCADLQDVAACEENGGGSGQSARRLKTELIRLTHKASVTIIGVLIFTGILPTLQSGPGVPARSSCCFRAPLPEQGGLLDHRLALCRTRCGQQVVKLRWRPSAISVPLAHAQSEVSACLLVHDIFGALYVC